MNSLKQANRTSLPLLTCLLALAFGTNVFAQRIEASPAGKPEAGLKKPGAATFGGKLSERLTITNPLDENPAIDTIIAVVNSTVITRSELNARINSVERQLQKQQIQIPPRKVFERQVLERLILERAQLELAKENSMRIDGGTVDKTIARLAEQNGMSLQGFRNRLEQDGINFARFRLEIEDELLLARLREREVEARIQISESEIDNFIADQKGNAGEEEMLNLGQILLRLPENSSEADRERLRAKAEALLAELKAGADFKKMAASQSAAPEALEGGAMGLKSTDKIPSLFLQSVATLKTDDLTMVRSANGFHILKVLERKRNNGKSDSQMVVQTRARHILMRPSETMSKTIAKQRLVDIRQNILDKKESFDEMARKFSVDTSAQKGGELGWLYQGDTVPEFEEAMGLLAPGEISPIVETQFGFHVIEVMDRKRDEVSPERQRSAVRQTLRERKSEEAFQDWLRQLRDRTYVEIRLDNRS